ncbi:hypothetical protein [Streptomyces sp. NPDC057696]|uniref:hypothetical protein n=1 Tax=unclassified Streptomyces TaxID=2593676 RepID=UPI0036A9591B
MTDPKAPRLCLVTGSEGTGKSLLLAWLIRHGTRPGTSVERRVHGFVPQAGQTALTTAWMLAQQLSIAARTPGELLAALAGDKRRIVIVLPDLHDASARDEVTELAHRLLDLEHVRLIIESRSGSSPQLEALPSAVMDLDAPQWTDATRHSEWVSSQAPQPTADEPQQTRAADPVDLNDPAAVCAAEPWLTTARYEQSGGSHGGLRAAWLRAGASLIQDQARADRAVTLRAALGDDADPRLAEQLAHLATGAAWRVSWSRVRGDITPPWPGPARAMAPGNGHLSGTLLVADHQDTVHLIGDADAAPAGRLPQPVSLPRDVAVRPDGTAILLDAHGQLVVQRSVTAPKPTGIAALLDNGSTPEQELLDVVSRHLNAFPGTALASHSTMIAVGDAGGTVHGFSTEEEGPRPHSFLLHQGAVTALAVVELPQSEAGSAVSLLYSGGADGRVRVWRGGADPLSAAVAERSVPVTALAVARTGTGLVLAIGWADGLVEHRILESAQVRTFRPGASVASLALTSGGQLVVGTNETLVCLQAT